MSTGTTTIRRMVFLSVAQGFDGKHSHAGNSPAWVLIKNKCFNRICFRQ
jgi:hypothetical protein